MTETWYVCLILWSYGTEDTAYAEWWSDAYLRDYNRYNKDKYSLLMRLIKIKSPANFLWN